MTNDQIRMWFQSKIEDDSSDDEAPEAEEEKDPITPSNGSQISHSSQTLPQASLLIQNSK